MNILLDTHIFIWFSQDDPTLEINKREIIEDENNTIFISVATFWEIAIKKSINKLRMNITLGELYRETVDNGFEIIPILFSHTARVEALHYHHKDPFDRIIIAQAMSDDLAIMTADKNFARYDVTVIQ